MNPYLSSLAPVSENARYVSIDVGTLDSVAARFSQEEMPIPSWRAPVFPDTDDDVFLNFVATGNSINFAYRDFESKQTFSVKWKDQLWRGAYAMWACLLRALEEGKTILNSDFLETATERQLQEIFEGESVIPMLSERCAIFNEVGKTLRLKYGGSFSELFRQATYRAFAQDGIVPRLVQDFESFRDESPYKASGTTLKFNKRAQLLVMMYQGRALNSKGLRSVEGYEDLGPIADYAVPRALRTAGILRYAPGLEAMIRNQVLIAKDSPEEQEIRAQTTRAQVMLLDRINRVRQPQITVLHLDYKVWILGRDGTEPHHLTRTTAY
jgi:Queuosine salvage protein